jgi:N-acetylmuramoyl-L-alanine amidase CwlA
VAVHAFVDDKYVCQHLPWNHRAWHCADSGNNTHISFEMCEPKHWTTDKEYFKKMLYKFSRVGSLFVSKKKQLLKL